MRFTPEFLDEIKSRVSVSDVVGRKVRLKKAGREWRGLSPFNQERTPSFFVNDAKMAWFDFSSGRNGNIFDFLMATEGLSFPEAVERLAAEAGLDLPTATPETRARDARRASLTDVLDLACQFFERQLADRAGAKARAYLDGRGLTPQARSLFRIGYAPAERYALRDHLAGKGVAVDAMVEAGLLVSGDDIAVPYDRFRDRVMFPIADRGGRVIAFGGRTMDPSVPAKYLNSPETPLFHKGALLYNHHRARPAAAEAGTVIAVEGYVDVIAMTMAGFPHVVAPLGTALTEDQCGLLWRLAPEPILCFDGDGAGRRAAFRAIDTALPLIAPDRTLRFAFLPEGQDPDDLARSSGSAAIGAVLGQAKPLIEVLWARETDKAVLDTPERRAGLERRLSEVTRVIADESLRRHYQTALRERFAALTGGARDAARRAGGGAPFGGAPFGAASGGRPFRAGRAGFGPQPRRGLVGAPPPPPSASLSASSVFAAATYGRRDVEILMLVMNHPALLERHAEDLAHLEFRHADLRRLRDVLVALAADHPHDHVTLKKAVDDRGLWELRRRIETFAEKLPHWCLSPEAAISDAEVMLGQALALHRKARELHRELREAELLFGREGTDSQFARLQDLQAQVSTLEGTEAVLDGYGNLSGHKSVEV